MLTERKILLSIAAIASCAALPANAQEPDDNHVSIGVGALFVESPFEGGGTQIFPLPILSIKHGPLYLEGGEVGVELDAPIGDVSPSAQLFVAARNTVARDRQKITADVGARLALSSSLGSWLVTVERAPTAAGRRGLTTVPSGWLTFFNKSMA